MITVDVSLHTPLQILSAFTHFFTLVVAVTHAEHQGMLLSGYVHQDPRMLPCLPADRLARMHTDLARLLREYAKNVYPTHHEWQSPRALCLSTHAMLAVRIVHQLTLLTSSQATPIDTHAQEAAKWAQLANELSSNEPAS